MKTSSGNKFDLYAPIMPGKSAAGICLGDNIASILQWANVMFYMDFKQWKRYYFGPLELWVDGKDKIVQIDLKPAYKGKLQNTSIGIKSTLEEVISAFGECEIDGEGNIIVKGFPGYCFITTGQFASAGRANRIVEIYVYNIGARRLRTPKVPDSCPICGNKMRFDLILIDGRCINSLKIKVESPKNIAGYGYYCGSCQHGWTGEELLAKVSDEE